MPIDSQSSKLTRIALILTLSVVVAACTSTSSVPEVTHDGLVLQEDTVFGVVYAKPGVELSGYKRFAVHHCEVAFRKNWLRDQNSTRRMTSQRVTETDMDAIRASLAELCEAEFLKVLADQPTYPVVTEERADAETLLLKPNIINLDVAAPDVQSPGVSRTYTTESGEMTLYLEVVDASTGEILFRIVDRRRNLNSMRLQWSNSVTNTADAKRILNAWGKQFREGLDRVYRGTDT
jgi:hypothetical protein